ncbi:MAG: hypothetical protein JWQ14_2616 [Adhaeribacter sp.]|nr:hypothetical protein [Adhaeribacter sp.]
MVRIIICCAVLVFLTVQLSSAQDLKFENVHFQGSLGFSQSSDKSYGILYRLRGLQDKHSRFLFTTFDSSLQVHQANILLYKRNNALASSGNNNYSAHLFQRVSYDSLKVLVLNKEGEPVSKKEYRISATEPRLVNLSRTDNDSLFTFFYKAASKKGNFFVKKVNLAQEAVWEQELTPAAGTVTAQFINTAEHIWVVCQSKPTSLKMAYTIVCLDNLSGKILGSTILHQDKDRREIADLTIGPDKELVLIGRFFSKSTISRTKPGNFFFTRISSSGERLSDIIYDQKRNPNALTALSKTKILWESLTWNPAGHWEIVGESFRTSAFITDFMVRVGVSLVTFGSGQIGYGKLLTKDLIHVQITTEGQVKKLQVYNLPSTRLVLPRWCPAYEFAKIAKASQLFRFRGIIAEPYSLIVKTKDEVQLLETSPVKTTSLTGINHHAREDVLGVLGNQLLLYNSSSSGQSIQVRRLPLPGSLFPQPKAESTLIQP